jgi:hypothetical protein
MGRVPGVVAFAAILGVAALGTGCGGIGASGSVSPASFFLPGIGQNTPKAPSSNPVQPETPSDAPGSASPRMAFNSADLVQ